MAVVKLRAGETSSSRQWCRGWPTGIAGRRAAGRRAWGIDLGLGYLARRTHRTWRGTTRAAAAASASDAGADRPGYGIDEDTGWCRPDNTLPMPPLPADPISHRRDPRLAVPAAGRLRRIRRRQSGAGSPHGGLRRRLDRGCIPAASTPAEGDGGALMRRAASFFVRARDVALSRH
jgi:hypothetical protein